MAWLAKLCSFGERRRLRQSFAEPLVRCYQRDAFRFYENGHWVTVEGELMSGSTGVDRIIYRQYPLRWNDTGEALTVEERERVLHKVAEHLDRAGIRWKFDDAGPPQTA